MASWCEEVEREVIVFDGEEALTLHHTPQNDDGGAEPCRESEVSAEDFARGLRETRVDDDDHRVCRGGRIGDVAIDIREDGALRALNGEGDGASLRGGELDRDVFVELVQ